MLENSPYKKWESYELPQLTETNYGYPFPSGMAQISKELMMFRYSQEGLKISKGQKPTLYHFLNIIRMLWPHKIDLYKDVKKGGIYLESGRIWNNYCLDIARKLCEEDDKKIFAGPASANKTYMVAAYDFVSYICAPSDTMVMISTTSGSASERRIWADIKDFYREARWKECGIKPIGEIIEYLKAIVFDPLKELGGADKNNRDFRNGISVIPIATDSSGEAALSTIQGTKNTRVFWTVDEMAQMQQGVTRPTTNLMNNNFFQFDGIGNSSSPSDPHGNGCMPKEGLPGLNVDRDREWISANGNSVLFLHGEESPNNHPYIDQSKIKRNSDYPFPYASNPFTANKAASELGFGDIEVGKQTIDYWKFQVGFWPPLDASRSLYTRNLFTSNNADKPHEIIIQGARPFGAGDFAFTVGGDDNSFMSAVVGYNSAGKKIINFSPETKSIKVKATDKREFIKATAGEFVTHIKAEGIAYEDFGADTGNDAVLMFKEMSRSANTHDFVGISSVGDAVRKDKYKNKVTELWFNARDLIKTGCCRGINLRSKYFTQLTERRYEAISKTLCQIEKKKEMKKRTGRSPDDADAFIYLCYMIIRSGIFADELSRAKEILDSEEIKERESRRGYDSSEEDYHSAPSEDYEQSDYGQVDEYESVW